MKSFLIFGVFALTLAAHAEDAHDHGHDHAGEEHTETCGGGACTPESMQKAAAAKAPKQEKHDDHADHKDEHGHGDEHAEAGHGGEHADEHGDAHETPASVGAGKAVSAIRNEGQALKLSSAAQKKIGLEFSEISGAGGVYTIPKSALLEYQASTGLYRLAQDEFIELIPVKVMKRDTKQITVKGALSSSEKIATKGIALLRAAQLEASGQGGEGHAH